MLTSPQHALLTELPHIEESHNKSVSSHSEVSFANEPEQKSSTIDFSKRNETVNSKDKKIPKRVTLHDNEGPSPKKANCNVSLTRIEALNNKDDVLNYNGTQKKRTKYKESPSNKEIPNANAKEATICVEDSNLEDAANNGNFLY